MGILNDAYETVRARLDDDICFVQIHRLSELLFGLMPACVLPFLFVGSGSRKPTS